MWLLRALHTKNYKYNYNNVSIHTDERCFISSDAKHMLTWYWWPVTDVHEKEKENHMDVGSGKSS